MWRDHRARGDRHLRRALIPTGAAHGPRQGSCSDGWAMPVSPSAPSRPFLLAVASLADEQARQPRGLSQLDAARDGAHRAGACPGRLVGAGGGDEDAAGLVEEAGFVLRRRVEIARARVRGVGRGRSLGPGVLRFADLRRVRGPAVGRRSGVAGVGGRRGVVAGGTAAALDARRRVPTQIRGGAERLAGVAAEDGRRPGEEQTGAARPSPAEGRPGRGCHSGLMGPSTSRARRRPCPGFHPARRWLRSLPCHPVRRRRPARAGRV